jgi:3-methyl-2-oxobutanoate hydroxymethyltransferase
VLEDMLGLNPRPPKFVKVYGALADEIEASVKAYATDVRAKKFPTDEQIYK